MYEALACREFAGDYCEACRKLGYQTSYCAAFCLYAALVEEWEKASVEERLKMMWLDLDVKRLSALAGYGEELVRAALRWLADCERERRDVVLEALCAGALDALAFLRARCRR